jgi:glycerate 2-kinase
MGSNLFGALQPYSLRIISQGPAIGRILAAAVHAVEPGTAVERFVSRSGAILSIDGREYDLSRFRQVSLLGIGKAAVGMSKALADILGAHLESGLVVTKHPPAHSNLPFPILEGGHPLPDGRSLEAGKRVLEFVSALNPQVLLLCLISGGGSALVAAPLEGLPLADLQALTSALLACGAGIDEINCLRRRLDRLKGGGLVQASSGATIASLILSDVIGDPLEAIASGPTAPDPTSREVVLAIVEKYGLRGKIPKTVQAALENSQETASPGDPMFEKVQNVIVGSNHLAVQAALKQAEVEEFHTQLLGTNLQGEARLVGKDLAHILRQAGESGDPLPSPACIITGGETTVTLKGEGRGGRNTELALSAVRELRDLPGVILVTFATDGEDGTTGAAGAVVTGDTFRRASELGMDPQEFLERNDSYTFFAALDDLLVPGPTGTNVNDLVFLFVLGEKGK